MNAIFKVMALLLLVVTAACGSGQPAATNTSSGSGETFSIEISGDLTSSLSSGAATARFSEEEYNADVKAYVLWFGDGEGLAVSVIFYDTEPPQPGTYNITTDMAQDSVSGLVVGRSSEDHLVTFATSSGTITLDTVGETYSGSFEFTSQGGAIGSVDQEVSVTGTFSNVQS